jgi:hypothetical protein
MSLKTSAEVASMMEYLVHKAETGEAPSEHTLALRMLAASVTPNAAPIASLAAAATTTTAAAATTEEGTDKKPGLDDLMAILSGDTQPPAEQVKDGKVPSVPVIAVVPEAGYMKGDVQANYASLLDSQSLCQLYAGIIQLKDRPQGWNISQDGQAAQAFSDQANYAWQAMTGPLAGFFVFSQGDTVNYHQTLQKSDVHNGFLGTIFGGFGFSQATMKELDDLLTGFTTSLGSVPMGDGGSKTIDHVIRLNLVPQINVSGDDANPDYIYQPTTTVIYLKIDTRSYRQVVGGGKNSSLQEKIDFNMTYTIFKFQLNVRLFEKSRPKFDKVFELLTGNNMNSFTQHLVKQIESSTVNPK